MNKESYKDLLAAEGAAGDLMRALLPLEDTRAVKRAHLGIRKQLKAHADDEGNPISLGSLRANADGSLDLNGIVYDVYKPMRAALEALESDTITLNIHSGGGSAFEGSAIYNLLRQDGREVRTVSMGISASAASLIFMAGDQRIVAPGAMIMIHDVWSCAMGNASEMRAMAEQLDAASDAIAELYAERAGGKVSEWRDRMSTDNFIGGDEAVEMGLATGRETPAAKPRKKADPADTDTDADAGNEPDMSANAKRGETGKEIVARITAKAKAEKRDLTLEEKEACKQATTKGWQEGGSPMRDSLTIAYDGSIIRTAWRQ